MPHKRFYTVSEVSEMLTVPATTLRYWEEMFPMFNPNRLPSGRRRFTQADVKTAEKIKELLYIKGLKIEAAVEIMNKTYREAAPRRPHCTTTHEAIALLDEVKAVTEDPHASAKIEAVINYLGDVEKRAD